MDARSLLHSIHEREVRASALTSELNMVLNEQAQAIRDLRRLLSEGESA